MSSTSTEGSNTASEYWEYDEHYRTPSMFSPKYITPAYWGHLCKVTRTDQGHSRGGIPIFSSGFRPLKDSLALFRMLCWLNNGASKFRSGAYRETKRTISLRFANRVFPEMGWVSCSLFPM